MSDEYQRYKELRLRLVVIEGLVPEVAHNQHARALLDAEREEAQDELYLLSTHLNEAELALITSNHPVKH